MKTLLVAPQLPDTTLGAVGSYCKGALEKLGYDLEVFDFRESQYLKSPLGAVLKKGIKKALTFSPRGFPFVAAIEKEKMNQSLLRKTREFKPDILFVLMGDTIFPETLKKIKAQGIITVNWFLDSVLASIRKDVAQEVSPFYDYFFIVDTEDVLNYIKIGARYIKTMPLACNPEVHKRVALSEAEKKSYGNDVCFLGTLEPRREKVLAQLADFDLGIWGRWQEERPELKRCYRKQQLYGEEAVKIYNASKIVLDIPMPSAEKGASLFGTKASFTARPDEFCLTPRIFEVPACGAFLLTAENPYLDKLYEIGKEIICYRDEKELLELVKYYLSHPDQRKLIAQKGQRRALDDHTYERRLKEMFAFIEKK